MDKVCFIGIIEKEQVPLDVWEITLEEDLNVTQMELMDDWFPNGDVQIWDHHNV